MFVHHSFVISSSKNCVWLYISLHCNEKNHLCVAICNAYLDLIIIIDACGWLHCILYLSRLQILEVKYILHRKKKLWLKSISAFVIEPLGSQFSPIIIDRNFVLIKKSFMPR